MQEFLMLIVLLLSIAFLQKGAEVVLDKHELGDYKAVVQVACIITSYVVVGRYIYVHLLEDLLAFLEVGF